MRKPENIDVRLLQQIRHLIADSRTRVAVSINAEITLLYWQVGKYIKEGLLSSKRADYGLKTVENLSRQLTLEYGKGWSKRHLHNCIRFAEVLPDPEIVHALRTQLTWTHLRTLISIDDPLKREFYIEICKMEKWSSRQLEERIQSMLYERTAISQKPDETIKNESEHLRTQQQVSPNLVFRDPYLLDFLGLKEVYSENDLEAAILVELAKMKLQTKNGE